MGFYINHPAKDNSPYSERSIAAMCARSLGRFSLEQGVILHRITFNDLSGVSFAIGKNVVFVGSGRHTQHVFQIGTYNESHQLVTTPPEYLGTLDSIIAQENRSADALKEKLKDVYPVVSHDQTRLGISPNYTV